MAEYIERDVVINRLMKVSMSDDIYSRGIQRGVDHAIDVINEASAADVAPVRNGRWTSRYAKHWKGKDECGECGFHEKDHRDLSHYKYCPSCGARMDGDNDG